MYRISYHSDVSRDLTSIGTSEKKRIKQAIETKLLVDPVRFGKPLQHSLRGLRSFRVGDYRVVFMLEETDIFVVLVSHRSTVYEKATRRHAA